MCTEHVLLVLVPQSKNMDSVVGPLFAHLDVFFAGKSVRNSTLLMLHHKINNM
jgi:hypothetical protein